MATEAGAPSEQAAARTLARAFLLLIGAITLTDMVSQLVLTFAGWTPETPLRRLSALQTVGTQVTVTVLAAVLIGVGFRVPALWSRSRLFVGAAGVLAVGGVLAFWFAVRIPGLTDRLLADVTFTEPDRLLRGSRQAMAGWVFASIWLFGTAWLMWRHRPRAPSS